MKEFNKDYIKNILIIKPRGIGDVVLSTIILKNIKNYFTDVRIYYLTENFVAPVLLNIPEISGTITFTKDKSKIQLIKKIRKYKFDLIIDLWTNPTTAILTVLSGARYRVGYSYRGRKYAYNILGTSSRGTHHSAEHNLELLKTLKIPIISNKILLNLSDEELEYAKNYMIDNKLSKKDIFAVIPSGGWASKKCEPEKFVEIIEMLQSNYDAKIIIPWGPGDEEDVKKIENLSGETVHILPATSLRQMTAILAQCKLIIANDSGPMHIGAALGIPTIGIFGPTNPLVHGPYGNKTDYIRVDDLNCINCNLLECPFDHECMKQIEVSILKQKVENILK